MSTSLDMVMDVDALEDTGPFNSRQSSNILDSGSYAQERDTARVPGQNNDLRQSVDAFMQQNRDTMKELGQQSNITPEETQRAGEKIFDQYSKQTQQPEQPKDRGPER